MVYPQFKKNQSRDQGLGDDARKAQNKGEKYTERSYLGSGDPVLGSMSGDPIWDLLRASLIVQKNPKNQVSQHFKYLFETKTTPLPAISNNLLEKIKKQVHLKIVDHYPCRQK